MNKRQQDLKFGYQSENDLHEYLEGYFGELNNFENKYYEFDKYNDKYLIEIKTRRIRHNQYDTLMFGFNKFDKGQELLREKPHLEIYYIFRCTDGVFYWKHNSTEYEVKLSGRRDRGRPEMHDCIHIKTENLKPIDKLFLDSNIAKGDNQIKSD